jgi:hypothetical protein
VPAAVCAAWLVAPGCRPDPGTDGDGDADADGDADIDCEPGAIVCDAVTALTCNSRGDGYSDREECTGDTPFCSGGVGCVYCVPRARQCNGDVVEQCNAAGSGWDVVETCDEGDACSGGFCGNPCSLAAANSSYEGCEYRAVTLMNAQVSSDFTPAIVVSNRNAQTATVTVTRGGAPVAEATVAPNSTQAIELPWVLELKQVIDGEDDVEESTNVADGSYRVVSTLPVTVYQFNPLEYGLPRDCVDNDQTPGDGVCYSYSNDASLLLPVHVLTEHYIVMSRPNLGINYHVIDNLMGTEEDLYSFSPSILAVVNPNDTAVTATIRFSAPTQPGPGVPSYEAGQSADFTIAPGGVLQIAARLPESCEPDWVEPEAVPWDTWTDILYGYCEGHDLTGTEVSASLPVAVFGGHNCDFIPFNRWACDHLEEQLFPYETWGRRFVLGQSQRENGEPDVVRVLSGSDNNRVRFSPSSVHGEVTISRGDFVELELRGGVEIVADEPVMVGQFLVGQNYNAVTGEDLPPGDPAFALAVPVEQYRTAYNFLAPSTYDRSYVNVTTSTTGTASIELDGRSLGGEAWSAVGDSGYSTLRLEISPGSHSITSGSGVTFGILVYGFGQYTSYMYPGGLDLNQIAIW